MFSRHRIPHPLLRFALGRRTHFVGTALASAALCSPTTTAWHAACGSTAHGRRPTGNIARHRRSSIGKHSDAPPVQRPDPVPGFVPRDRQETE